MLIKQPMDLEKITHTCVRVQGALCSDAWREIKLFAQSKPILLANLYIFHTICKWYQRWIFAKSMTFA